MNISQQLFAYADPYLRLFKTGLTKKIHYVRMGIVLFTTIGVIVGLVNTCSSGAVWNSKTFKIARDTQWNPLQLYDKERNLTAFTNELLLAIAQEEKFKIQLYTADQYNLLSGLDYDQYDAILSPLDPSPTNKEHYNFSDPLYRIGPVLIVSSSSPISSITQMNGKTIGVLSGSSLVYKIDSYPNISIRTYDNILDVLLDLEKNTIDGVILDALTAYTYTSNLFKNRLKVISHPLTDVGIRLITKHQHSNELIDHFNKGLATLKANGIYDQLIMKWNLYNPELKLGSE